MIFESETERIFKERVIIKTSDLLYVEKGSDFIRFRDPETGKLFELKLSEKKSKQKIKEL